MPEWLPWLAIPFLVIYIGGPVLIWLTFKQRVYSRYERLQPEQLPAHVLSYFTENAPDLAAEGFEVAIYFRHTGAVAAVESYGSIWLNRARGQQALLGFIIPSIGGGKRWVEFETVGTRPHLSIGSTNVRAN